MNKIKSLFKASPIAIVIVGLLIAGVASAALVNYLSNPIQATTTVTSPITMKVNSGADSTWSDNGATSLSISTTGGSDFTFTTLAKNNANNTINGYPVI
ncbi:MAG: hypothetical protein NTV77_02440, partial [Candidatus Azambacteria bacterium]|nr:hypothetical protein [Candidatus Azambacteria bacterium]